ncbi:DUF5615 family PIN-like protein [Candidatus Thiosymbion oneisti]|uniref:DUF5615 family PIN-like protein n=1 Tax=Candidatus Thiosymbion oneisti TaxID=589554 RepID=UPI00105E1415
MRFLVDECTGPAVGRWLRAESHEVFSVDDDILRKAHSENWILITNDKGLFMDSGLPTIIEGYHRTFWSACLPPGRRRQPDPDAYRNL